MKLITIKVYASTRYINSGDDIDFTWEVPDDFELEAWPQKYPKIKDEIDKQAQDLLFEHLIEWGYYEVGSEPIKNDEEDDND